MRISKELADFFTDSDKEYLDLLQTIGDTERLEELLLQKQEDLRQHNLYLVFAKGEELSKQGHIDESQQLLIPLIDKSYDGSALLFKRIAINCRKQKDYKDEIKYIEQFINEFQPKYGGKMWLNVFEPRLLKAQALLAKSNN